MQSNFHAKLQGFRENFIVIKGFSETSMGFAKPLWFSQGFYRPYRFSQNP